MVRKPRRTLLIGIVILVLSVSSSLLYAEDRGIGPRGRGSVGYFIGGIGGVLESGSRSMIYSTGGGGHGIINRWILGGEGHSYFGPANAGGYGFLNIGYLVFPMDSLLVYPLIGLGGGSMTREASPSVSKCALVNPSVAMDFLIPVGKKASGGVVGLRAGYTFTVYSDTFDWSMPHVRLVVGGFGFER